MPAGRRLAGWEPVIRRLGESPLVTAGRELTSGD